MLYRYYVSQVLLRGRGCDGQAGGAYVDAGPGRVPAAVIAIGGRGSRTRTRVDAVGYDNQIGTLAVRIRPGPLFGWSG